MLNMASEGLMYTKLVSVLVVGATACYTYVPVKGVVPGPGAEVRSHFEPMRDVDIGEITVRDVDRIEGTVYRASADTLSVWGQWLYSQTGIRYDPQGAMFNLAPETVRDLEVRKLNPIRSALAVTIGAAIGYGMFNFIADPGSGGNNGDGPTGVEPRIVPSIP